MITLPDAAVSVRDARERYFEASGFDASAYDDDWVRLRLGPLPIVFPNTAGRKRAVPFHDLHHVATGYGTDLAGEAEIGAWEIASGCLAAPAALLLNMLVVWLALWFAPGRVYRAFVWGRHTRNLYGQPWNEALLDEPVSTLRARLGLDAPSRPTTAADRGAFSVWLAAIVGLQFVLAALLFGLPAWCLGAFD